MQQLDLITLCEKLEKADKVKIGLLSGQKPALKMREVWYIRSRIEGGGNVRDLALFNLAIDSKLRGCDLVRLHAGDVYVRSDAKKRAIIIQKKTGRAVQFEITDTTRKSIKALVERDELHLDDYLFRSRIRNSPHLSTRQYARIVKSWVEDIGLNPAVYGTHSLRRTKAAQIYRKTGNLRAVQLLLGHTKLESTVRNLGVEVEDALEISESIEM